MEKKNNENLSNGKTKVLTSKSNSYNNIQPRVVLQRLSKHYTFGVASRSDKQHSTSGYLSPNNKCLEVGSSVSDDTSDSTVNSPDNSLVTTSTSKPTTSGTYFTRKEVFEFKVASLREADLPEIERSRNSHNEDSCSDCSFHSSPKEVVVFGENKTETEEGAEGEQGEEQVEEGAGGEQGEEQVEEGAEGAGGEQGEQVVCQECIAADADKFDKPTSPESTGSDENCMREPPRTEAKIRKAVCFLKLLIDTYGRRVRNTGIIRNTFEIDQPSTSGSGASPIPEGRPATRSIVIRPQRNNLKDCLVRVWLSVSGQKKKKKFHVRLSQLILLLNDKNHPLHKFRNALNLQTLKYLSDNELKAMARLLCDFACAKRVKF